MDDAKRYWKSLAERDGEMPGGDEFPEPLSTEAIQFHRRDFLRAAGLGAATAALAGCSRAPVEKAIPLMIQPEELVPGKSLFYATTCGGCSAGCGVLAKVRDGRPVKLEGNPLHPLSRGGLCAMAQAAVYDLFDSTRLQAPLLEGKQVSWQELDRTVSSRLAALRQQGGAIRLLSSTITSPTLRAAIAEFLAPFRDARHISFDPLSSSAILDAHERTHGIRALPRYRFDRAEVIASFDADFLGTWISPVEYTAGWRAGRDPDARPPRFSYHAQLESRVSLTGTKADWRCVLAPSELGAALNFLAAQIGRRAGIPFPADTSNSPAAAKDLERLAERLWQARGRSLVIGGMQDVTAQVVVNFMNHALGNYGSTLELSAPSLQRQGSDAALATLADELNHGKVAALLILNANPSAELPGDAWTEGIKRVPFVISISTRLDETARLAHVVAPDHHFLESWADAEPVQGIFSLSQPAISPIGQTRSALESLAAWSGQPVSAYEQIRAHWRKEIFPRQSAERDFQAFWDRAVHDGVVEVKVASRPSAAFRMAAVEPVRPPAASGGDSFELVLYPKVAIGAGRQAHNPLLQELPDPVSKVGWDNYACLSPAAAAKLGVAQGDVVRIEDSTGRNALELPVYLQPGQHDLVVAVALGYGRVETERFARIGPRWWFARSSVGPNGRVGENAARFLNLRGGALQYCLAGVRLAKTGRTHALACTQTHHTVTAPGNLPVIGGRPRPTVHEVTLASLLSRRRVLPPEHAPAEDLYPPDHPYPAHHWAMVVDTSACTGCSACVVACQAENNIPVVGRDEMLRQREMHWLRIDRYYTGENELRVVHQPMMCQQCSYAPCETVCPVLATVHSEEGLNQQIYNRCVGTRYCANNCPYKTRRFNWFDYPHDDRLQNLALNPDVTVRSRGVMEKCTFCVQRIQEAKIEARRRGTPLADGAIETACQQSCPAQAIIFGDLNDPQSRVSRLARNPRHYRVLAEFNFRPSVGYLAAVSNREESEEPKRHG
jgi:molybdopterin-containing oxidoreductase family iron-sulfur binding subunit